SVALSMPASGGVSFLLSCGSTSGRVSGSGGGTRRAKTSLGSCLRASVTAFAAMRTRVPENSVSVFMANVLFEKAGAVLPQFQRVWSRGQNLCAKRQNDPPGELLWPPSPPPQPVPMPLLVAHDAPHAHHCW